MIACVDANVILRFLVGDPPELTKRAKALMESVERGDVTLQIDGITVAEVVWVLSSYYQYKAHEIAPTLLALFTHDGIRVEDEVLSALALYGSTGIDFADALLAARMQASGIRRVFSFDKHFDRVAGLERLDPGGAA